jgi:hypothetical protein
VYIKMHTREADIYAHVGSGRAFSCAFGMYNRRERCTYQMHNWEDRHRRAGELVLEKFGKIWGRG